MTKKTHLAIGTVCIIPFIYFTGIFSLVGIIGSIFPDIDIKIGLKHRTITHNILALSITTAFLIFADYGLATIWFVSYLSHLLLDSLTTQGVPFLYPLKNKYYGLKLFNTGGIGELLFVGALIFIGLLLYKLS